MAKRRSDNPTIAPAAREDIREILRRSGRIFGPEAAARYRALITQAVRDVGEDPERPGSQERSDVLVKSARTWHLQLSRRRVSGPGVKEPRHFLLYRHDADGSIEVARVLDDVRDFERHIPVGYRRMAPNS